MSLSKSRYRLAGTFAGAAVAVALIAVFPQTPELFFMPSGLPVTPQTPTISTS
jgi:uncharacterized membrane protein YccC